MMTEELKTLEPPKPPESPSTDALQVKGHVVMELRGPDGELKETQEIKNLVVTVGLALAATALGTGTITTIGYMAVGTSSTPAALGNTTLGTELARVALTSTAVASVVITYVASFGAGTGTGALVEAGLFNGTPAGTMLSRVVFAVVNKGSGDSLTITWTITLG